MAEVDGGCGGEGLSWGLGLGRDLVVALGYGGYEAGLGGDCEGLIAEEGFGFGEEEEGGEDGDLC